MSSKKSGVILGYLVMAITNLSSFLLTPLMLAVFGTGDFGVYKLVISFTSYFALADLGLSNAVVRYVSEYRTKQDKVLEGKFIGLVTLIDMLMGVLLLLAGAVFYFHIDHIFFSSFNLTEIKLLKDLFILVGVSGFLTLFINLAAGILKSYERFSVLKIVNLFKTLVRIGLITILLFLDSTPYEIVLVDTVLMILVFAYSAFYCLKKLKVKPRFRNIDLGYGKVILSYSLIVFVDAVAFHFFWAADVFIIGMYISSNAIAVYSIGTLIASLFFAFSIVISDVLMPEVVKKVTEGANDSELTKHMVKIGRIKFIILTLPTLGFLFLGRDFIRLWVGESFELAYFIAILTILPQMIAALMDVGLYVMWAKNKHKVKSFVSLGICIANIVLTVLLVQKYGIIGAAISTSFAFISGYLIFNSIYFHRVLQLNMFLFIKKTFHKLWFSLFLTVFAGLFIASFPATNWLVFVMHCLVITIIYSVSIWLFGLNTYEKEIVLKSISKFLLVLKYR